MDKLLVETSLIKLDVFRDMKKTKNVKDYYGILKAMRESYKETKINPVIVELHLLGL